MINIAEKYAVILTPKEAFNNAMSKRHQKIKLAIEEGMKGYDKKVRDSMEKMMRNFGIPLKVFKEKVIPEVR